MARFVPPVRDMVEITTGSYKRRQPVSSPADRQAQENYKRAILLAKRRGTSPGPMKGYPAKKPPRYDATGRTPPLP